MEAFVSFNLQIITDIYETFTKEEHQLFRALVNRRVFATGLLSVGKNFKCRQQALLLRVSTFEIYACPLHTNNLRAFTQIDQAH